MKTEQKLVKYKRALVQFHKDLKSGRKMAMEPRPVDYGLEQDDWAVVRLKKHVAEQFS